MLIEINAPFLIVKHSVHGEAEPCHNFEVWEVPADAEEVYNKSLCASILIQSFADDDFMGTRSECRAWIDGNHHDKPVIWVEKDNPLYAIGESV